MDLAFPPIALQTYRSSSQIARVLTEAWAQRNLYCAACTSDELSPTRNNTQAVDLVCPSCRESYQLKSGKSMPQTRIVDAAYGPMIASIRSDANPSLLYLHYDLDEGVRNLLLVPRFFFVETCIEKRPALSNTARRAGWVGCNIRLDRIAPEGRIPMVALGSVIPRELVRERYTRMAGLQKIGPRLRGWTLNVLQLLRSLGRRDFTLTEAYSMEGVLSDRFPKNRHVRPKIRQQLQVLRDLGIVTFLGNGTYRLN